MKVFVIMGNDYPHAVHADGGDAQRACDDLMRHQREAHEAEDRRFGRKTHYAPRIVYRVYPFDLQPATVEQAA